MKNGSIPQCYRSIYFLLYLFTPSPIGEISYIMALNYSVFFANVNVFLHFFTEFFNVLYFSIISSATSILNFLPSL